MSSNAGQNVLAIQLALECLARSRFRTVLSNSIRGKFPYQYITANRDGIDYVIGVVSRKEMRADGKYNEGYNIANSRSDIEHARSLPIMKAREPAFVALPLQPVRGIYSAYFGSLKAIGFPLMIPMLPEDRLGYEELAPETPDPRVRALI